MYSLLKVDKNYNIYCIRVFNKIEQAKSNLLTPVKTHKNIQIRVVNSTEVNLYIKKKGYIYNTFNFICKYKIVKNQDIKDNIIFLDNKKELIITPIKI